MREKYSPKANQILDFVSKSPLFEKDREPLLLAGLAAFFEGRHIEAVHLLVPQIEYSIRRILTHLGEPTTKKSSWRNGVLEELTLGAVLSHEAIKAGFSEDARLYFKTFLTDQRGQNVRNRVAHGLMQADGFNSMISNRLFHITLLLSLQLEPTTEKALSNL